VENPQRRGTAYVILPAIVNRADLPGADLVRRSETFHREQPLSSVAYDRFVTALWDFNSSTKAKSEGDINGDHAYADVRAKLSRYRSRGLRFETNS
jgi:hypothetical protein